ncbi:exo-alpha-sialidase [Robertkochia solimangrovi]|uniref:exo-alpha-sialidase n=1 Tax=Robertkochia solimangrovi TaxID=2213046 RepID=UPI00117F178C|nr:exo-alpha-sialidase [Robertkochia solimangrovi]TRZ45047.1 glycosyl hydrolase [Robertkochia solimangrovi]
MKIFRCLCILLFVQLVWSQNETNFADKPVFRDPVYDGAADPCIVWNPNDELLYMFYTNRRANQDSIPGVSWVHGTDIGIAVSKDGGNHWTYQGICNIDYKPDTSPTYWAPEVILNDGTFHMYLTYVPGIFTDWYHPRQIIHLTSDNLTEWTYQSTLELASERCIDADVIALPEGGWRMFYNNENDGKSIYYTDSNDLYTWNNKSKKAVAERGEGPVVFHWKGKYRMICDSWRGLSVYSSDDLSTWSKQENNILKEPGKGIDDGVKGGHPDVLVLANKAYVFYFTHPGRIPENEGLDIPETRRSSIQVAELELDMNSGFITCDRDKRIHLKE